MAVWRRPRLRRRLQLMAALATALIGVDLLRWATLGSGELVRSDFLALLTGGALLARGERAHVYDPWQQSRLYSELIRGAHAGILPFNHAPLSALIYAAFSRLPLATAYHAFGAFQGLCLLGGCLLAWRAAPWPAASTRLLKVTLLLCALAGAGTLPLLLQGQDDGVIALAVGAAYLALRHDRRLLAGGLLGFAGAGTKPHLLLGLFALIAVRRDLRLVGGLVGGGLLALLASLVAVGPAGCVAFVRLSLATSSGWLSHWFLGLPAIPTSWLGETGGARAAGLALSVTAVVVAGWLGSRWRATRLTPEAVLFAATCLSLAAAVHLLGHDLVILAPLLVPVGSRLAPAPRSVALVLAGWGLLLAATALDGALGNETHAGRATGCVLVALAAGCTVSWRAVRQPLVGGGRQLRQAG